MTEHQDDTMAAGEAIERVPLSLSTTASALGADAETTWVPADPATVDQYAWSEGDEIEVDLPQLSHPWVRAVAIAAGVLALGAVAAVVVAANGQHANDLHESALPVTVHPTVAAPVLSAPVVTVTVTPTAAPESQGDQLVDGLRQNGINVTDPDRMGRDVCQDRANRRSVADIATAERAAGNGTPGDVKESEFVVMTAIAIYCPQYSTAN
jgi:hypothetical protein